MPNRFCTQCGQPLNDYTKFCVNCGAPVPPPSYSDNANNNNQYSQYSQQQQYSQQPQYSQQYAQQPQHPMEPKPKNYLVLAILATLFCCLPFGIVSIIFSSKVNNLWDSGDYAGAQDASNKAKTWVIVSAIVGFIANIIVFFGAIADEL